MTQVEKDTFDRTLVDEDIEEFAKNTPLIKGFEKKFLKPASYDLRIGRQGILVSKGQLIFKRLDAEPYVLQPWETCLVETLEEIKMPPDMIGTVWIRVRLSNQGLSLPSGVIDPGHDGPLYLSVRNDGASPITLTFGEPVATVRFTQLHKNARNPRTEKWDRIPVDRLPPVAKTELYNWTQVNQKLERIDKLVEDLNELREGQTRNEDFLRLFLVATATGAIGGFAIALMTYELPYLQAQGQVTLSVLTGAAGAVLVGVVYGFVALGRRRLRKRHKDNM